MLYCTAMHTSTPASGEKPPTLTRQTLTVDEAAALLGIGRTTAYVAVRDGSLPTIRIGRRLLVPRAQLERLLGESTTPEDAAARQ